MRFDFNFFSSLLLISFSQGLLYSFLLFIKAARTGNKPNYWLSIFILLCSFYIAPWMLGFAGWYDNQPYRDILFYVPFQHLFLVGPILYFYTQSLLNPSFRFSKKSWLHLLPGILYLFYTLSMWVYDKLILHDYFFYKDGLDKDFDYWYQKAGLLSMLVYFILSNRYYNLYKKLIVQVVSYADKVLFKWIKTYLYSFMLMLILPIVFDILCLFFPDLNSYQGSWWFFLFFSLIMYFIAISGYSNTVETKIPFRISAFENKSVLLLTNHNEKEIPIYIDYEITETNPSAEILLWKNRIETLIISEKLFQNPELTLSDLAQKLETNVAIVSKTINQGFLINFNDFINNYRIEAVKKAFENNEHKKSTLLGIAFDCGFNSKATFNRAFKKNTGLSPKKYLEKLAS